MKNEHQTGWRVGVIGGGPAGMAAAWVCARCGASVTLLERGFRLGGVLPQCIHTGFGTQLYGEDLTGGEYAARWERALRQTKAEILLNATVMELCREGEKPFLSFMEGNARQNIGRQKWRIRYADGISGAAELPCDTVILATGCTERTLPQLNIPGSRPAGIFTAGEAQRMMNLYNLMPGHAAVILGSGDIGLIMARRMALEGIEVKLVLGERQTGLARNIIQCVEDFDIPIRYGWMVDETHGYDRLTGVTIRRIQTGESETIDCDTLLVAAGLVPDRRLLNSTGEMQEAVYLCGNADHVHDLVDQVSLQGVKTGLKAFRDWKKKNHIAGEEWTVPSEVKELALRELPVQEKGRKGNMVCTVCPWSCMLNVKTTPFKVTGHACPRGQAFAQQEVTDPKRMVTMVLRTDAGGIVAAKTACPVLKANLPQMMEAARMIVIPSHVLPGETIEAQGQKWIITGKPIID